MCNDSHHLGMSILTEIKWRYVVNHTYFRICNGASVHIGKNVEIRNSRIIVTSGSHIDIGNNVVIKNTTLFVVDGKCVIGNHCIIGGTDNHLILNIENGMIAIGHHTKISAKRFWVRWGGNVNVGNYTNINDGSEIRCDKSVTIGDYVQISYNVKIWDTNTHNILSIEERRILTEKYYPYYGKELSRPITTPVVIGNDCWLGENVSILRGCILGDGVIVGYNSMLVGKTIPANVTVVTDVKLKIMERK